MDLIDKSGQIRNCLSNYRLHMEKGFLEGSLVDVTDRKKVEKVLKVTVEQLKKSYREEQVLRQELEEEARERGMFIDVLGHELRTPLTPMLALSAMLKE